jgi:hypothetical protein
MNDQAAGLDQNGKIKVCASKASISKKDLHTRWGKGCQASKWSLSGDLYKPLSLSPSIMSLRIGSHHVKYPRTCINSFFLESYDHNKLHARTGLGPCSSLSHSLICTPRWAALSHPFLIRRIFSCCLT